MSTKQGSRSGDRLDDFWQANDGEDWWNGGAPVRFHPEVNFETATHRKNHQSNAPLALYVHIPFCLTRCYFCTFTVVVGKRVNDDLIQGYLQALEQELIHYSDMLAPFAPPIKTIQLGGGTPSMLTEEQLQWLLDRILALFNCAELEEIIVEGFPSSVTQSKLEAIAAYRCVKFNIGVQTFDDIVLDSIGRRHEKEQAMEAIAQAVNAGLASVGIDLIYGLPFSTPEAVVRDVRQAVTLGVDHVALYPLWIYPKTTLFNLCRSEKISVPTLESRRAQLYAGADSLAAHGFHRYTAFHYSLHNQTPHNYGTWQMRDRDWLGAGQGAVSYLNGILYQNDKNIGSYIRKAMNGEECSVEESRLSLGERMVRAMIYGLRLLPMPVAEFAQKYGHEMEELFDEEVIGLERTGMIQRVGGDIELTQEGVLNLGVIEDTLEEVLRRYGIEPVRAANRQLTSVEQVFSGW